MKLKAFFYHLSRAFIEPNKKTFFGRSESYSKTFNIIISHIIPEKPHVFGLFNIPLLQRNERRQQITDNFMFNLV